MTQDTRKHTSLMRSVYSVSALTLVSRILGLVRDRVMLSAFGTGLESDAFVVAFRIPNLLRRLVAEGSLAAAFVPVFTQRLREDPAQARKAFCAAASYTALLTTVITAVCMLYATEITEVFAPGFIAGSEKSILTTQLTQIMFPYVVLVSLLALSSGVLNSLGVFAIPAAAPALLNIATIVGVLTLKDSDSASIRIAAWSVLVGGMFALLPQLWKLSKLGFSLYPANPFGSEAVSQLLRLMLPSVVSASAYQLMIFVNTMLASMLAEGSSSYLFYADRVFQFPLGVFSLAIATAVLPQLSRHAADKNHTGMKESLIEALRWVTLINIPATAGLLLLGEPIVSVLFKTGATNEHGVHMIALALSAFSLGLWPISCQSVLIRAFIAKKKTTIPAIISVIAISANIVLAISLMGPPNAGTDQILGQCVAWLYATMPLGQLGHVGLALAGTIASVLSLVMSYSLLSTVGIHLPLRPFLKPLASTILATLAMSAFIWGLLSMQLSDLALLCVGVPTSILIFGTLASVLGIPEARTLTSRITCLVYKKRLG